MKLFKKEPDFKFMRKKFFAFALSILIMIAGVIVFKAKGFNLGIDFTGGTLLEVSFRAPTSEKELRGKLARIGLEKSIIQRVGEKENKFFIKTIRFSTAEEKSLDLDAQEKFSQTIKLLLQTEEEKDLLEQGKMDLNNISQKDMAEFFMARGIPDQEAEASAEQLADLRKNNTSGLISSMAEVEALDLKKTVFSALEKDTFLGSFIFLSVEIVGPQVGFDMRKKVTLAAIWALLGMLVYIGFRFRFVYGLAAVITLFHDVMISLSFILFFNVEVSLQVVAALLTIIGYSLNDTIVIFDRVRDNVKIMRRDNAELILDRSINQTLSRTIVTSGTTLFTVLALFFLGGEVIHTFAFTLVVGVLVGTYSSIFQSCAWLKIWEKNFLGKKK